MSRDRLGYSPADALYGQTRAAMLRARALLRASGQGDEAAHWPASCCRQSGWPAAGTTYERCQAACRHSENADDMKDRQ